MDDHTLREWIELLPGDEDRVSVPLDLLREVLVELRDRRDRALRPETADAVAFAVNPVLCRRLAEDLEPASNAWTSHTGCEWFVSQDALTNECCRGPGSHVGETASRRDQYWLCAEHAAHWIGDVKVPPQELSRRDMLLAVYQLTAAADLAERFETLRGRLATESMAQGLDQQTIRDLQGRLAAAEAECERLRERLERQAAWLSYPGYDLHEPISKAYAEVVGGEPPVGSRARFDAVVAKLSDRFSAIARLRALLVESTVSEERCQEIERLWLPIDATNTLSPLLASTRQLHTLLAALRGIVGKEG